MHIERIVYPKLGIIDEIEVEDDEEETESEEQQGASTNDAPLTFTSL